MAPDPTEEKTPRIPDKIPEDVSELNKLKINVHEHGVGSVSSDPVIELDSETNKKVSTDKTPGLDVKSAESLGLAEIETQTPVPIVAGLGNEADTKSPTISACSETSGTSFENNFLPPGWSLQKLALELPLGAKEQITCISSFESNLYIGTSTGQVLHMYLFDDAEQYILIMQIPASESSTKAVSKILPVPDANMCLILAGNTVHSFTLPELSPCRIGKIKDAVDLLLLSVGKLPSERNKSDKVVVYTSSKFRVVHVVPTGIKLLRDINYLGAVTGVSLATGTLAHYSNICIIANDTRFDVVDMQQTRKIPLFDYNPAAVENIHPFIVPYLAQDTSLAREEYLLPICTEPATSMAMFISSAGDVTRGTLTWIGHGYPMGGLSVEWPHVIGVFQTHSGSQKLIFSSLLTFEVEASVECDALFGSESRGSICIVNSGRALKVTNQELLRLLTPISATTRNPLVPHKQFDYSRTVFSDGCLLYGLQKQSPLTKTLLNLKDIILKPPLKESLSRTVEFFSTKSSVDDFHYLMYLVLLLLSEDTTKIKQLWNQKLSDGQIIDPRLLMLYCVDLRELRDELWHDFSPQRIFLDIRDQLADSVIRKNKQFYKWLIREIHSKGDDYEEIIRVSARKLVYTETCENSLDILLVISLESDVWLGQNAVNEELTTYFFKKNMFLVLLHIYRLKQDSGNSFEQWSLKIIDLSLDLISGRKTTDTIANSVGEDIFQIDSYVFDLPKTAFNQLRENVDDEKVYAKQLLKLLQLRPDRGLVLLKSAKGSKFSSTHKHILDELSKSYKFDSKFSPLKIEYTEQAFFESCKQTYVIDFPIANELLEDYVCYLNQNDLQVEYENLNILYATYKIENDLRDPLWPKVTWIEYLHLHYRKGDCEEFLETYLKVYELIVLLAMYKKDMNMTLDSKSEAIAFLKWVFDTDIDRVARLQELKDYSTAEWLIFNAHPPIPRSLFILGTLREQQLLRYDKVSPEKAKIYLTSLMEYYLAVEDQTARFYSVMHAVNTYADQYLTMEQVLQLLPEDFPLLYVERFLESQLQKLENRRSDAQIKKALQKANVKLSKSLFRDYETKRETLKSKDAKS
ncbi:hypothetical protein METBIDRAFT_34040 [Metschnikowia bicuspidata var. bicuspidata NRRL YB-4993]|uniref:CNH domain-containing protein n=1 Tax=Metschnikowia bicuspidata var. bicuspidata NRRL YB-4993 TaxID=869754 RepID=A0A1A0HGU0_9ASCO|nr:hypothetical protein METBIDRAFT_34040 [Metschnikowia bicuspidata var. bicuspidata NRRL YB-4993]OBA23068.1 hypothetical protein METBIDRAFT_34040 [Metschnikowia bicuspidata var. bicuspidata NRRL YB-4993]